MKRSRLSLLFLLAICIFAASLAGIARAGLPMPDAGTFAYDPVGAPVVSGVPGSAKPMGVGSAPRHQLDLTLGLDSFPGPVDVYLGIQAPAISPEIFLVTSGGGLAPLSAATPFRAGVTGPLAESLFGVIPLSALPSGDYYFFCLVTRAGTFTGGYYLWFTSVTNLKASDLAATAVELFGGDAEAGTAILMALAREYSLEDVAAAINAGTLTEYGEIVSAQTRSMNSPAPEPRAIKALSDICDDKNSLECRGTLLYAIAMWRADLEPDTLPYDAFSGLISELIMGATDRGYSPSQIRSMTNRDLLVDLSREPFRVTEACDGTEAAGVCLDGQKTVVPDNDPPAIFSDVTPVPAGTAVPGLEGMTFPSYFKGTGSYWEHYSNPNTGTIECSTESAVYVAKVGGIGYWDGRLKVYAIGIPHWNSVGVNLECRNQTNFVWTVTDGLYSENGTYHKDYYTETFSGTVDILFNKDRLWGNYWSTESKPVYGGEQVTQKQWDFNLQPATEAEYNAVIGQ